MTGKTLPKEKRTSKLIYAWRIAKQELTALIQLIFIALGVAANLFLLREFIPIHLDAGDALGVIGKGSLIAFIFTISFYLLPKVNTKVRKKKDEPCLVWFARTFSEGVRWASMFIPDALKELKVIERLKDKLTG